MFRDAVIVLWCAQYEHDEWRNCPNVDPDRRCSAKGKIHHKSLRDLPPKVRIEDEQNGNVLSTNAYDTLARHAAPAGSLNATERCPHVVSCPTAKCCKKADWEYTTFLALSQSSYVQAIRRRMQLQRRYRCAQTSCETTRCGVTI